MPGQRTTVSEPVPFTNRPKCVKCGEERCGWEVIFSDVSALGNPRRSDLIGGDTLLITCARCGWRWTMLTLDHKDE
jgi:DNA-directed RNA polymerase subunit M/transcription elongation factor TFIIS